MNTIARRLLIAAIRKLLPPGAVLEVPRLPLRSTTGRSPVLVDQSNFLEVLGLSNIRAAQSPQSRTTETSHEERKR